VVVGVDVVDVDVKVEVKGDVDVDVKVEVKGDVDVDVENVDAVGSIGVDTSLVGETVVCASVVVVPVPASVVVTPEVVDPVPLVAVVISVVKGTLVTTVVFSASFPPPCLADKGTAIATIIAVNITIKIQQNTPHFFFGLHD